ncbi:hypothetical protein [Leuconostoc carnosum]|uniref:hypothetical protein n=1 Tax=Leuconostoc carnosum TaxID=1252 RepID=UPI00272E72EA|nr:hypothetical protein [Leuconostoc carnosum]WLC59031.1 hypothetical protein HTZ88_03140 [Leuconostoc carnosum]
MKKIIWNLGYLVLGVILGSIIMFFFVTGRVHEVKPILQNGTYKGTTWKKIIVKNKNVTIINDKAQKNRFFYTDINKDKVLLVNEKANYANKFKVIKAGNKITLFTIKGTNVSKTSENILTKE